MKHDPRADRLRGRRRGRFPPVSATLRIGRIVTTMIVAAALCLFDGCVSRPSLFGFEPGALPPAPAPSIDGTAATDWEGMFVAIGSAVAIIAHRVWWHKRKSK